MSTIHLENLPADLYQRIENLAREDSVSISEVTVKLLKQAVGDESGSSRAEVPAILAEIRRNPIAPAPGTPDSVDLLREDRNR